MGCRGEAPLTCAELTARKLTARSSPRGAHRAPPRGGAGAEPLRKTVKGRGGANTPPTCYGERARSPAAVPYAQHLRAHIRRLRHIEADISTSIRKPRARACSTNRSMAWLRVWTSVFV
ncbi:hypothetical protein GCM10020221_24670 [Streptomyces thioluteus]|uniref:Transposase n=1 Tax=Streptomyces thioluteus TaxID=66431 RepID=A0ABN3WWA2_STRTU